jgi:hypothetical protein
MTNMSIDFLSNDLILFNTLIRSCSQYFVYWNIKTPYIQSKFLILALFNDEMEKIIFWQLILYELNL